LSDGGRDVLDLPLLRVGFFYFAAVCFFGSGKFGGGGLAIVLRNPVPITEHMFAKAAIVTKGYATESMAATS